MSNKLCRACLSGQESFKYFLMDNVPPETYWFCTSIEVKKEENLPKALCNTCYDLLSKFFNFKQTCIQSQKILLSCDANEYELKAPEFIDENDCYSSKETVEENHSDHNNDSFEFKQEISEDLMLKDEKKKIEGTKVHQTERIQKSFKRKLKNENLKSVMKKIKGTQNLICDLCGKTFSSISGYKVHKQKHIKELSLQCTACTKTFKTRSGLQRHFQSSHMQVDLKYLTCNQCGKISKSKESLKMHLKIHGERLFLFCDICGKNCTTVYSMKAHRDTHMENRERPYTCEHCGKKFFTSSMLSSHVSKRHRGRRFICDICSYPFTEKSNLVKHLLIHEGKKLYKCDICDKSFGAKSTLVDHKRIHSGERPYLCSYCPKRFLSKKTLRDHHKIHTGEKPYKCNICEQAFTQCGTLNRHMKVHDRSDPVL